MERVTGLINDGPVERVSIYALELHGRNPRRGDVAALVELIRVNGFWGSVIARRGQYSPAAQKRNNTVGQVLAGNHRVKALRQIANLYAQFTPAQLVAQGWDPAAAEKYQVVDVQFVRVESEQHATRIMIADNRASDRASNDADTIAALLAEAWAVDGDLAGTGYDYDELEAMVSDLDTTLDALIMRDEPEPEPEQPPLAPVVNAAPPAPEPGQPPGRGVFWRCRDCGDRWEGKPSIKNQ